MMMVILILGIITAYINGMHDGGTIVATTITSRILDPTRALLGTGICCIFGALLMGHGVEQTMTWRIVDASLLIQDDTEAARLFVIAAFLGSMCWNLFTWKLKLPSSASHCLIGSMIGCAIVAYGFTAVLWHSIWVRVILAMVLSPLLGFAMGYLLLMLQKHMMQRATMVWNHRVKVLDLLITALLSISYGGNEAQKVAGVIILGTLAFHQTPIPKSISLFAGASLPVTGITLLCGVALGLGVMTGGTNMMRTVGRRIVKMSSDRTLVSQFSSILVVNLATILGLPISSTQVITGSVMGVGAQDRPRSVDWSILGQIAIAWILTLPAAALAGAILYKGLLLLVS